MRANLVTRNVLKIKRYAQRLTQRACIGEGGSYLWAPGLTKIHPCDLYSPYLPGTGKNVPMAWVGSPVQPQMIIFRILVTSTYVTKKEERRLNNNNNNNNTPFLK